MRYPHPGWLVDWHVYRAGAVDLLEGVLYTVDLTSPHRLPVDTFNYPPLAALIAVPFLPLFDDAAGVIWVVMNIGAVAATAFLVASILRVRHRSAWAGIGFAAYTVHPWAWYAATGNNSPLVLLLVTAFAHQYLRGRSKAAALLLGSAIGIKVWPIALVPLLVRERSWSTLAWTVSLLLASAVASLAWLGPHVIGDMVAALQTRAEIEPGNPVLGLTWVRETFDWWPPWGGYAVAAILALVSATGMSGLGLGILAGLAAVPNLWVHYLPATVVGCLLLAVGYVRRVESVPPPVPVR